MSEPDFILISERALVARIRRRLARKGNDLHTAPDGRRYEADGEKVVRWVDDLETLARELGCLKPWEYLED